MSNVIGDIVDVKATFRNASGTLADPNTVTASVLYPSGATATPTASQLSTGIYTIPVSIDEAGIIYYRVEGVGNSVDAAAEGNVCGVGSSL